MLTYSRVRDLVHGFVYLTSLEERVIQHPLFQRIRHIRQNDVAFYVYPSLNISRFEHSLGCVSVVGRMSATVTRGYHWKAYSETLSMGPDEFMQVCRLYALLHDVGHLPLSHLFEMAFDDFADKAFPGQSLRSLCTSWFGGEGFEKLHEACASRVVKVILEAVDIPSSIKAALLVLLTEKTLPADNALRPIKLLVDSELDADRVNSTRRDGLLAGGEYGGYDIDRLCRAIFVQPHRETWRLAYSHKAATSIEALLLDRCRTHINIHFHHRVVALKVAVREAISFLLLSKSIKPASFALDALHLRDDYWLWSEMRKLSDSKNTEPSVHAALRAVLHRDKSAMSLLWKNRPSYKNWNDQLLSESGLRKLTPSKLGREYERYISGKIGIEMRVFWLKFRPVEPTALPLTDDNGEKTFGELLDASNLTGVLTEIWDGEPHYFVVALGDVLADDIRSQWIKHTADWLCGAAA